MDHEGIRRGHPAADRGQARGNLRIELILKFTPQILRHQLSTTALAHDLREALHLHNSRPAIQAEDDAVEQRGPRLGRLVRQQRQIPAENAEHDLRPAVAHPRKRTIEIKDDVRDLRARHEGRAQFDIAGEWKKRAWSAHAAVFSMKA